MQSIISGRLCRKSKLCVEIEKLILRSKRMENQYEKMSLAELRIIAKEKGIIGITTKKKHQLVELLSQLEGADTAGEKNTSYQEAYKSKPPFPVRNGKILLCRITPSAGTLILRRRASAGAARAVLMADIRKRG